MLDSTGNNKETTCVTRRENRSWIAKSAKNPFKLTSERRQNKLEYSSASALTSLSVLLAENAGNSRVREDKSNSLSEITSERFWGEIVKPSNPLILRV